MYAVSKSQIDVVKYLLEHGASKDIKTPQGESVLDIETSKEIREILKQ